MVRCFDVPDLGVNTLGAALPGRVEPDTELVGGTFLALGGGLMLLVGSLGDLLFARGEEGAEVPAPEGRRRFEGGAAHPAR